VSDSLAPNFDLTINNNRVDASIRELITSVEYESVDGMADALKISLSDTLDERGKMLVRDSQLFMPGNDVSLFGGYGASLSHIGLATIRRVRPTFPGTGTPTIEVTGYTADSLMADSGPEPLREIKNRKKKGPIAKNSKAGRRWKNAKYSDAVRDRAEAYGFETDVDPTLEPPSEFIQKANMKDYDFVQGIANLTGFVFWVDGSADGKWTLHFKNPLTLRQADLQEKKYTFKYGDGDYSTLLNFEPELAIQGSITKLLAQTKDPLTGVVLEAKIEEENDDSPDTEVETGNVRAGTIHQEGKVVPSLNAKDHALNKPLTTSSDIKLFIEDFSFEIHANRRFNSEAELAAWAQQWFRRNRENFMLSRGTLIGLENMRARQTHNLTGLGIAYDGEYQFTRVRHVFTATAGYQIDFSARRTVPELPPVTSTEELQIEELLRQKSQE